MEISNIAKGDFLIADPFLQDQRFSRSVVLLCENDATGSLGFIINKEIPQKLGDLLHEMEGNDYPVLYGGPVRTNTLHFIHTRPDIIPDGYPIGKTLFWGGDFDTAMQAVKERKVSPENFRIFLGQSGWSENQLRNEIHDKTWLTAHARKDIIFSSNVQTIWKEAIKSLGRKYLEVVNYPIDPTLN